MSLVSPDLELRAENFAPGYLDTPRPDRLPLGAMPNGRNAFFYDVSGDAATTGKRPGSRLITPTAISLGDGVDLWEFRREAAAGELLGLCNGAWSKYNEASAFAAISGATGYTGDQGRVVVSKNQALLHDGVKMQLYDGAGVRDVGFVKPTGVTALGVAAGPGVTGDYSARYTWYDQTHNHESSPAVDATATQTYTNQQRVHTKPSGSPPANVTHWRAYVRREDTEETYWTRVATVAIATTTHTEAVIDDVRADFLPLEAENDPPPVAFAFAVVYKGYLIGFPLNSSDMYMSKQGDIESFPPKQKFPVAAGDGEPARSVHLFGTSILIQKPHRSWHLVGTRVPFDIEELKSSLGNVSQEAGVEVLDWFYGWDAVKGPYRTNLVEWVPLGDTSISRILKTVNRSALASIRAVHDELNSLIIWAVPTTGSERKRTLLAFNYVIGAWLPPITGLEYRSLVQYKTTAGAIGVYSGDEWGRVWRLFDGGREGPPSGTVRGTVTHTGVAANTLRDDHATFYTTGSGLAGMPVAVRSPGRTWQWRRIASNTATVLTLDTTNDAPWSPKPTAPTLGEEDTTTWRYIIGGIQWFAWGPWLDGGKSNRQKKAGFLFVQTKPASTSHAIEVRARFNDAEGTTLDQDFEFTTGAAGGVWGEGTWGTALWASISQQERKTRIMRNFFKMQLLFQNFEPDQPVEMTAWEVTADWLPRRRVNGAG